MTSFGIKYATIANIGDALGLFMSNGSTFISGATTGPTGSPGYTGSTGSTGPAGNTGTGGSGFTGISSVLPFEIFGPWSDPLTITLYITKDINRVVTISTNQAGAVQDFPVSGISFSGALPQEYRPTISDMLLPIFVVNAGTVSINPLNLYKDGGLEITLNEPASGLVLIPSTSISYYAP